MTNNVIIHICPIFVIVISIMILLSLTICQIKRWLNSVQHQDICFKLLPRTFFLWLRLCFFHVDLQLARSSTKVVALFADKKVSHQCGWACAALNYLLLYTCSRTHCNWRASLHCGWACASWGQQLVCRYNCTGYRRRAFVHCALEYGSLGD